MGRRSRKTAATPPSARQPANDAPQAPLRIAEPRRSLRVAILLLGLILPQAFVLGSSLWGGTILLPLDILAGENLYLPRADPTKPWPLPADSFLSDLVFQIEPYRRLSGDEVRAGRWPLWNPYNYAGHPLLAANQPQVFSPYRMVDYLWPSPIALAWQAMARALVGGIGMYLALRVAMRLSWLPSLLPACGFPWIGILVLGSGYPGAAVLSFLPWMFLAADRAVRKPSGSSAVALAGTTACSLLAGHTAFAGQVLLVGGTYFLWRLIEAWRDGRQAEANAERSRFRVAPPLLCGALGVTIGFLLAAPQTLPTVDYLRSSLRIAQRQSVGEETPPSGPSAIVQLILPYAHGSTQLGSAYVGGGGNRIESATGGYGGLLFTLALAPLGWLDRSRRRWMMFWTAVAILAITPTVGVPLLSLLFEVPPVSLLRNNRLVFASAFAVLAMAGIGLQTLVANADRARGLPGLAAAGTSIVIALIVLGWCAFGGASTPDATISGNLLTTLWPASWPVAANYDIDGWFTLMYRNGVVLSVIAIAACIAIVVVTRRGRGVVVTAVIVGVLAISEMIAASVGVNVRTDPSLYYPRLAWMDAIAGKPGRICGYGSLPANLNLSHRLRDIRGYDASDPTPIVELIQLARVQGQEVWPSWAVTQFLAVDPVRPSPAANLLGVRHIVGRGTPPAGVTPWWTGDDYWLVENALALPRITLPAHTVAVGDKIARLSKLADPKHDPAKVAIVPERSDGVPGGAQGNVTIVEDLPCLIRVQTDLSQGGLLRLADAWDAGWVVRVNGEPAELLCVDHALRGVVAPAGKATIEFEYAPWSFRSGLRLCAAGAAAAIALLWFWRPK